MFYGDALRQIIYSRNKCMRLPMWEKSVIIKVQRPDEHSKMTHPYLYVESIFEGEIRRVPWKETFPEIFSDKWEVLEETEKPESQYMDFSKALFNLKNGKILTREDWNADGQYVIYMPGYPNGVAANESISNATGIPRGKMIKISPYFMLKNDKGEFVNWVPSTGDILSEKWKILKNPEIIGFQESQILSQKIKDKGCCCGPIPVTDCNCNFDSSLCGILLGLDFINR